MRLSFKLLCFAIVTAVCCAAGCGGPERKGGSASAPDTGRPPAKMTKEQKSNKAAVEMP